MRISPVSHDPSESGGSAAQNDRVGADTHSAPSPPSPVGCLLSYEDCAPAELIESATMAEEAIRIALDLRSLGYASTWPSLRLIEIIVEGVRRSALVPAAGWVEAR